MRILATPVFLRVANKLHAGQKSALDEAVRGIIADPLAGDAKIGDLAGVRVCKSRMDATLWLLAYEVGERRSSSWPSARARTSIAT